MRYASDVGHGEAIPSESSFKKQLPSTMTRLIILLLELVALVTASKLSTRISLCDSTPQPQPIARFDLKLMHPF
jgi:hypothetical protein